MEYNKINREFSTLFLRLIFIYVMLFSASALLESGLIKLLVNMMAILIFAIMFVNWAFVYKKNKEFLPKLFVPGLVLYYTGMIGSLIFNFSETDYVVFLKFLMVPFFFVFGFHLYSIQSKGVLNNSINKKLFLMVAFVPLMFWILQLTFDLTNYGAGEKVAFFPNRNTASLYAVLLISLYNLLSDHPFKNIWVYVLISIMFGALGVLLAVLLSLLINISRSSTIKYIFLAMFFIVNLFYWYPDLALFQRFQAVFGSIALIYDGTIDLYKGSYQEAVLYLNTSDLSFIFRLMHWLDILSLYSYFSIEHIVFGSGVGSSVRMTASNLVPHNDYLRVLFELGLFSLFGFLMILWVIFINTFRSWQGVPLLAVIIYFFSENLLDNYVAMMIFFFTSGSIIARFKTESVNKTQ